VIVGFDVSQTGAGKTGCGYFADSLARALAGAAAGHQYILYPTFGTSYWDPQHRRTACRIEGRHMSRRLEGLSRAECDALWETPAPDLEARLGHPDVVHSNNYYCPRGVRRARLVFTLYDLVAVDRPELTIEANRLICFRGLFEASLRADMVVAISRHSRRRFLDVFPHYPADRIRVVYPGSRFEADPERPASDRPVPGLRPQGFWLSVGTLEPRKNLRQTLRAFARLAPEHRRACPLALVGGEGWLERGLLALARELGIADSVRWLGYVEDRALSWLYRNCFAFLYPSLEEGFGLPVVEALSLGAAVVTSDGSSLPEVAGEAALMVAPQDEEALVSALRRLAADEGLRRGLQARAPGQAAGFSWPRAAGEMLDLYEEAVAREPLTPREACA
jgi:glycosyltransferase involved in cell wall biosynthesis